MRIARCVTPLVLISLAYYACLAIGSRDGFPRNMQDGHLFPYLADKPVGEDGYYMLTVAWNRCVEADSAVSSAMRRRKQRNHMTDLVDR